MLSISNSGQSSMKLWVFSSCGAGSTGWVCSQYKAGLGGWELNVLHKGGTVSWWQRITTGLGPTSSFSFALPRMHSGRDYQGRNCQSMKLCCFVSQLWSAPQRHRVPTSPLKQRYRRLTALQESGWWQLNSAHGFQGGGGEGKQQFLTLSSSSSAEAR